MLGVADEHRRRRRRFKGREGLEHGLGVRLSVHHVVGADPHRELFLELEQAEAAIGTDAQLAGHQRKLRAVSMKPSDDVRDARVSLGHGIVMLEIEVAIGREHRIRLFIRPCDLAKRRPEGRAYPGEPVLVRQLATEMNPRGVVKRRENEVDRIEQSPIKIE